MSNLAKHRQYLSRAVSTQWVSNGKSKGKGNKKNGNKYLSWAFSEAAEFARRYDCLLYTSDAADE